MSENSFPQSKAPTTTSTNTTKNKKTYRILAFVCGKQHFISNHLSWHWQRRKETAT